MRGRTWAVVASLTLLCLGCGGSDGVAEVPDADPGWRAGYEEGSRESWIFALHSDYVVLAEKVTFTEETTSPSGAIPYLLFDVTADSEPAGIPEGLRLSGEPSPVPVFESIGIERHPSVLEARQENVYLLLGALEEGDQPEGSTVPNLHVVAAFSSEDGAVEFLGPFAEDIEGELAEAQEVADPSGVSELDFLMALLGELKASGGDPTQEAAPDSILARMAAEREARDDPEAQWHRAPVDQRPLDPELTPPEVIETLTNGRIFVANDTEWEPGAVFRLQTDQGISLQVDLSGGFSDGYVVLTPPESTWLLQIGNEEDESGTWETIAEVPVSRWTESGAIAVDVTSDDADVQPISVEEFDRRVEDAAVQLPSE